MPRPAENAASWLVDTRALNRLGPDNLAVDVPGWVPVRVRCQTADPGWSDRESSITRNRAPVRLTERIEAASGPTVATRTPPVGTAVGSIV